MCFTFCFSRQVYYELDEQRKKVKANDVAICRVEQLCPFPYDLAQRELKRYPSMYSELATEAGVIVNLSNKLYLYFFP